jgi:ATP-dependent Clp protease protease subunit
MASNPPLPPEVYVVFCASIDQSSVQKILGGVTNAVTQNVKEIHMLFQSVGGTVGDGIALYNFFQALTIDLTLYNVGQVSSAALIAYLGAKKRKVSAYASFMTHRTTSPAIALEGGKLRAMTESVILDDKRTEAILRKHITMPEEKWTALEDNLWLSAQDAVKFGIADEIAEFAPPPNTKLFNIV